MAADRSKAPAPRPVLNGYVSSAPPVLERTDLLKSIRPGPDSPGLHIKFYSDLHEAKYFSLPPGEHIAEEVCITAAVLKGDVISI